MKCTDCGSEEIRKLDVSVAEGNSVIFRNPDINLFSRENGVSGIVAHVCTDCGLILKFVAESPERLKPKNKK